MKTYKVILEYWQTIEVTVEANSEAEAEDKATEDAQWQLDDPDITITLLSDDEIEPVDHSNDPMPGQLDFMEAAG